MHLYAFICCKQLHSSNVNTWYSSIDYIQREIELPNFDQSIGSLWQYVKNKLCKSYFTFWNKLKYQTINSEKGKLGTYFSIKNCFKKEKYLELQDFKKRQSICKLRISAHSLKIETDRYSKKHIERSQRLCSNCSLGKVEDELHFLLECPLYDIQRDDFFKDISNNCCNFINLNKSSKFLWLLTQENVTLMEKLGCYICDCFELRRSGMNTDTKSSK